MNRTERLENLSAAIDGELAPQDELTLKAWLDIHPEDLRDFGRVADVVKLVRCVPEVDPPADLHARILRAVAESTPVEVDRETALEWLDGYFEDELSLPQRQVVEHYLAVDNEFAEKAALHAAMLSALRSVVEEDVPSALSSRLKVLREDPERAVAAQAARTRPRRLTPLGVRRIAMTALATAAVFALAFHWGRSSRSGATVTAVSNSANSAPVVPAAPRVTDENQPVVSGPATSARGAVTPAPPANQSADLSHRNPTAPVDSRRLNTPPPPRRNNAAPSKVKDSDARVPAADSHVYGQAAPTGPAGVPVEPGNGGLAKGGSRPTEKSVEGSGSKGVFGGGEKGGSRPDPFRQIEVPPF